MANLCLRFCLNLNIPELYLSSISDMPYNNIYKYFFYLIISSAFELLYVCVCFLRVQVGKSISFVRFSYYDPLFFFIGGRIPFGFTPFDTPITTWWYIYFGNC